MLARALMAIGFSVLAAGVAFATPPGPGQHFDCSDGGDTSCAADDTGCVSNTSAHYKCSIKISKTLASAYKSGIACHNKQATMRFKGASENGAGQSEENCEEGPGNSAKATFEGRLADLGAAGVCDPVQLANAAAQGTALFGTGPESLDVRNVDFFCDSTSGVLIGDDDSGWVPNDEGALKCSVTVTKAIAKLRASVMKCHEKMNKSFLKGDDLDEEACEESDPDRSALAKFNRVRDKLALKGICPPCLDSAALDAMAAAVIAKLDTDNQLIYPCTLGP